MTDLFFARNDKDPASREYKRALRDFWTGWYELRQLTKYDFRNDNPLRSTTEAAAGGKLPVLIHS